MPLSVTGRHLKRTALAVLVALVPVTAMAQDAALRIGLSTTPTFLDPHEDSSSPNNATSRHIFDSLINRGGAAENKPQLATEWKPIDETHWEFKLREDVTFHDGSTFDAEDVVASLLRVRDKPNQSFASYTRNIANVTAKDPYTVVIETTVSDPMILNSLSRLRIISADHADAEPEDFASGEAAIGTGPFKFASYMPGDRLELVRNEDYFAGAAPWSEVTLRMLPDDGARLASLLAGEMDLIEALPAEGMDRVERNEDLKVINGQSTRIVYLGNDVWRDVSPFVTAKDGSPLDTNPLKDERVRRALLMSINRPAIVDRVMQKNGTVADQFVAKGFFGHSEAVERVEYDPEGAKALLAEAGYPDGFKMTIHGPSGRYVKDSEIIQAVGQMFSRIGIDTSVEVLPWTVYADKYAEREYSLFLASWGVNTGEVSNPAIAIVATSNPDRGTGRDNGSGISDPEIDALLEEATSTLDEAARELLLQQVSQLTFERQWLLPLHYENVVMGAKNNIDFKPRGDKYTLAYEVMAQQ